MISFKLFKYIYFRYIIYSIVLGFCMGTVIGFTFGFISGFLAGFHIDIDNTIKGILFLLQSTSLYKTTLPVRLFLSFVFS